MDMRFEYKFHAHGACVGEAEIEAGHIWLDVGNALREGVIDHHQSGKYFCTVETLCDESNRHLIDKLKSKCEGTIVVHTHEHPDTDALFSIYLLRYYLNKGEFPPKMGAADKEGTILEYVSKVDSGDLKIRGKPATLYKAICCLSEEYYVEGNVDKCLTLIGWAIDRNYQTGFSFMDGDILAGLDEFNELGEQILQDEERYKADKANRKLCREIIDVDLPINENDIISEDAVKALVWNECPTCGFDRLWARDDGYVVTVVPQENKKSYSVGDKTFSCTNTIISIPPNACDKAGHPYSLKPLAYLLEQYEQYREIAFLGDKNNKRDHGRPRGENNNENRFFESPWSVTSDPWYFSDDNTLVQSPRSGSLLTTEEVIKIVETFGKCYVKAYSMRALVPFTFNPLTYNDVFKRFKREGWSKVEAKDIDGEHLPWMMDSDAYISTFIEEYKSSGKEGKGHFVVLKKRSPSEIVNAVERCEVSIEEDCYIALFQYGAGIVVLEQERFKSDAGKRFVSFEIDRLNAGQDELHEYFTKHPIFAPGPERLSCLAPHFYTSIEVSSECLNMSNSLISRYAELICDVFDNSAGVCAVERINHRAVLASSRKEVALVVATAVGRDSKNNFNEAEYAYLDRYSKEWFFMYVLALQQKYSLVEIKRSFASLLGKKASKDAKKKASKDAKEKASEEAKGKKGGWFKGLLTSIATHLGIHASRGPKELREKLIEFYATSYFTTATDDELGDKIYCHWHENLMIKDIKTDIMEQINRHDEYISEKLTAIFNKISNWLIPLAIASTIIQVSVNAKTIVETFDNKVLKGFGGTIVEWLTAFVALTGPIAIVVLGTAALVVWWLLKKKKIVISEPEDV